jgi:hypothetical protein
MEASIMMNQEIGRDTGPQPNWLSRVGMKMMAAAAGGARATGSGHHFHKKKKDEGSNDPDYMACCHLALPDRECEYKGDKADYTCPEGWHRQWWFCCEGTRQAGCGECTKSTSTCWQGPFECSIWWWTGQSC